MSTVASPTVETVGDTTDRTSTRGLAEIAELVGHKCLAFVCAATTTEIAERLEGKFFDEHRETSLQAAREVLSSPVVTAPTDSESKRMAAASMLTMWNEDAGTSVANLLRQRAGGDLPAVDETEPIAEALGHLARDGYAALLIPGSRQPGMFSMNGAFRGPWNTKLQQAVLEDSDLREIFKGPVDSDVSSFALWSSTGHGEGGVQLVLLGTRLLGTPAAMARAQSSSITEFIGMSAKAVDDMRTLLVARQPLEVPAIQGLDGLVLPAGVEIPTQWGTLRPLLQGEEELVLSGYKGAGNAVIETTYEVSLSIEEMDESSELSEYPEELAHRREKAEARLQEAARMIGLAVVLAKEVSMPAHIGPRYTVVAEPFSWQPAIWGRGPMQRLSIPVELSRQEVEAVAQWTARIGKNHHERMSVAVGRTISAHERLDPTDGFVDALIAWDALFGSPSGESVVFRVATGFALLLAEDEKERRNIGRRARVLYGLRSKVVHGSIPRLDWSVAAEHRQEAVQMLLRALCLLYESDPDLLAESDRTNELLMRRGLSDGPFGP
jgi:hypothetical protein